MKQIDTDNFAQEVLIDKPVVVTFGYPSCGGCRILAKSLAQLEGDGVKVVKVDVHASLELSVKYDIATVPTTLFFARGHERVVLKGVAPLKFLREQLANAVKSGDEQPADENIIAA